MSIVIKAGAEITSSALEATLTANGIKYKIWYRIGTQEVASIDVDGVEVWVSNGKWTLLGKMVWEFRGKSSNLAQCAGKVERQSMAESKRETVRRIRVTPVNLRERHAPRKYEGCDVFNKPAPKRGRKLLILPQDYVRSDSLVDAAVIAVLKEIRARYTEKYIQLGAYCSERIEWHPTGGVSVTFTPVTGVLR